MLSIQEIIKATQGQMIHGYDNQVDIETIEFDSRKITKNSLFIPLKGQRDGHEFIQAAKNQGAAATLWEAGRKHDSFPEELIVIEVPDVLAAFQELAVFYLNKVHPKVVAITGSNGKTSTKDMTEAVLSQRFATYKTQGNFNNDIGLPYTILHMPSATEVLVLEMGMDHAGEIEFLSRLATPDVAAITMIGESHLEFLGSRAGIAKAKAEILAGLSEQGELIIPADEPLLAPHVQNIPQTVTTFGFTEPAIYQATIIERSQQETRFMVSSLSNQVFTIPFVGDYNVKNALIAIIIGLKFGLSINQISEGLARTELTQSRSEWLTTWNGAQMFSDVYNANPTAMKLVLETIARVENQGKKIAVLADMGELGDTSAELHQSIAPYLEPYQIVILYGELMKNLHTKLLQQNADLVVYHVEKGNEELIIDYLHDLVKPEDILVLKGSNSMGLVKIVEKISSK